MFENFNELLEQNNEKFNLLPGAILTAKVVKIGPDFIIVNAGLKSEAKISRFEFSNLKGELEVNLGDDVEVVLELMENGLGETKLSRDKAKRLTSWRELEEAMASGKNVIGVIIERVRGGFTVEVNKIRAFLPGSLLDVKPIPDPSYLEGRELDFKVLKADPETNNVVVSRRAVLLAENTAERTAILETMHEGDVVTGVVKNLTDYGAFIDLGGVDGLLHITDISWRRIKHPNEILKLGEQIQVKILRFDREKNRVSLGLKQLSDDPWKDISRRYPSGARLFGKITNITDYGCFVEIEPGIEGLVHVSEMDWINKNTQPGKLVTPGQEVEVMVLEIDEARRRISLGMKQCKPNPWKEFAAAHQKGEKIIGKIKSITDFGLFIGIDSNIDGLVHVSDLSWTEPGEKILRNYKKGQDVEAVILNVDAERERVSLGVKQLETDIYSEYLDKNPRGSTVSGKVVEVNAKEAIIDLGAEMQGCVKAADISKERVQDATQYLNVGDEIEAKIIGVDKKNRHITLSIKELHSDTVGEAPSNTQLGDLLKEHMEKDESNE
jgi:small subunit ribosomal protein S1